jgi:hypothetical protein
MEWPRAAGRLVLGALRTVLVVSRGNDLEFGEPYEAQGRRRRLIVCYLSAWQKEEQIYCCNYKKRMTLK